MANWLGEDKTDRPWVVEEALDHTLSVRTKDWKYIEPSDGEPNTGEFTNIETGYRKAPSLYDMRKVNEQEEESLKHPEIVFPTSGNTKRCSRVGFKCKNKDLIFLETELTLHGYKVIYIEKVTCLGY
jgi:hypothetical protein